MSINPRTFFSSSTESSTSPMPSPSLIDQPLIESMSQQHSSSSTEPPRTSACSGLSRAPSTAIPQKVPSLILNLSKGEVKQKETGPRSAPKMQATTKRTHVGMDTGKKRMRVSADEVDEVEAADPNDISGVQGFNLTIPLNPATTDQPPIQAGHYVREDGSEQMNVFDDTYIKVLLNQDYLPHISRGISIGLEARLRSFEEDLMKKFDARLAAKLEERVEEEKAKMEAIFEAKVAGKISEKMTEIGDEIAKKIDTVDAELGNERTKCEKLALDNEKKIKEIQELSEREKGRSEVAHAKTLIQLHELTERSRELETSLHSLIIDSYERLEDVSQNLVNDARPVLADLASRLALLETKKSIKFNDGGQGSSSARPQDPRLKKSLNIKDMQKASDEKIRRLIEFRDQVAMSKTVGHETIDDDDLQDARAIIRNGEAKRIDDQNKSNPRSTRSKTPGNARSRATPARSTRGQSSSSQRARSSSVFSTRSNRTELEKLQDGQKTMKGMDKLPTKRNSRSRTRRYDGGSDEE